MAFGRCRKCRGGTPRGERAPSQPSPASGGGKEIRARAVPPPVSSPATGSPSRKRDGGAPRGRMKVGARRLRNSAFRRSASLICRKRAEKNWRRRPLGSIHIRSGYISLAYGLLSAHDRDGGRSHHRRRLTKVTPGFLFVRLGNRHGSGAKARRESGDAFSLLRCAGEVDRSAQREGGRWGCAAAL